MRSPLEPVYREIAKRTATQVRDGLGPMVLGEIDECMRRIDGLAPLLLPLLRELDGRVQDIEERLHHTEHQLQGLAEKISQGADQAEFDIGDLLDRENRWRNIAAMRRLARAAPLSEDRLICRALGKYRQYLSASDTGYTPFLVLDGFWEYHVTEFVARNVTKGMTVLDLGANFGYFTLLMADLVEDHGKVYAFEPNPAARQMLSQTLLLNNFLSRVVLDGRAIWDQSGETVTFHVPPIAATNARIVLPPDGRSLPTDPGSITVETVSLDDLPVNEVSFIKADIEGSEERLWHGSREFLARNPDAILLLEFNCSRCLDPRSTLEEMGRTFPLRHLDEQSYVREIEIERLLASTDDWLLVLSRRDSLD